MGLQGKLSGILIDLSGTLHVDNLATCGAVEGLRQLRAMGTKFRFATNTTKESARALTERLNSLGFGIRKDEIFSSLIAARDTIKRKGLNPMFFLEPEAMEDFRELANQNKSMDSVLVGLSPQNFDYENLNKAFRLLIDGAPLIAVHTARYYATKDGLSMGPGGFVAGLEYASGVSAHVVGKPEKSFFELALADMNLDANDAKNVVVIGDDVVQDLGGGAKELGFIRYLVRTGKYRRGDEYSEDGKSLVVDGVFDTFADAVNEIEARGLGRKAV